MTTKKKYAPIPGLSTGDHTAQSNLVPNAVPTQHFVREQAYNAMPYFIPTLNEGTDKEAQLNPQPTYMPSVENTEAIYFAKTQEQAQNTFVFNPDASSIPESKLGEQNKRKETENPNAQGGQVLNDPQNYVNPQTGKSISDITMPHPATIIPPPPMFSNIQRRDENPNSVKSVLPPSVARRISANQPVIKPQATISRIPENIFVPAPIFADDKTDTTSTPSVVDLKSSAFAPFNSGQPLCSNSVPESMTSSQRSSNIPMFSSGSLPPPPTNDVKLSSNQEPATGYKSLPVSMLGSSVSPSISTAKVPMTGSASTTKEKPADIANVSIFAPTTSVLPSPPRNTTPNIPTYPSQSTVIGPPVGSSSIPGIPVQYPVNTSVPMFSSAGASTFLPPPLSGPTSFSIPPKNNTSNLPTSRPTAVPLMSTPGSMSIGITTWNTSVPVTGLQPTAASIVQPESQVPPFGVIPQANQPPPPTFFNPSAMTQFQTQQPQNVPQSASTNISQILDQKPSEPPKPILEPPKATGMSYRMTKKRPQYYSGPIEGVGSISNNIKPAIAPVETGSFHGAMFTPAADTQNVADNIIAPDVIQAAVPFDISRPTVAAPEQSFVQPECNTAFDFSRGTTESYDTPKQEPKGFGIIGSLKSKLSALDINKIQDSVTTFFDPAYKEVKNETVSDKDMNYSQVDYGQNPYQYSGTYPNQSSNFEIYVPTADQQYQPYNYQMQYQDPAYQSLNQNLQNYYENQGQTIPTSSYYSNPSLNASSQVFASNTDTSATVSYSTMSSYPQDSVLKNVPENVNVFKRENSNEDAYCAIRPQYLSVREEKPVADTKPVETQVLTEAAKPEYSSNAKEFYSAQPTEEQKTEELDTEQLSENSPQIEQELGQPEPKLYDVQGLLSNKNASDFFDTHIENQADKTQEILFSSFSLAQDNVATLSLKPPEKDSDSVEEAFDVSAPLFGLSTMLADKTKELSDLECNKNETPKDIDTIFNRNSNFNFFDMESDNKTQLVEIQEVPDLNICETCREVNKPEDRDDNEVDDLTAQLIENITSPIQLLNPVEVPLPESKTPDVAETEFDSNQCAEISHITEETIEIIQVQSATELLEKDMTARSYGWTNDLASPKISEEEQVIPNPIGFFVNPFDIPKNASDEIKAELKFTYEDIPQAIPVPPSAPLDEDSKSDETGIDVHSIEQDATKDFPFEEYVIEPSETDDDKIEKEKSTEDIQEIDSFTNRVERFKKMEETDALEKGSPTFDLTAATSPYLPMPSYFDTGNYAADTHYRNSLTSPNLVSIGPDSQICVPPGFEGEFEKKKGLTGEPEGKHFEPYIPDTSTQTKPTYSPTFSVARSNPSVNNTVTSPSNLTTLTGLIQKQSDFNIFSANNDNIIKTPSAFDDPQSNSVKEFNQKVFKLFDDSQQEINQDLLKDKPLDIHGPTTSKELKSETENLLANIIGLTLDEDIKPANLFIEEMSDEIKPAITLFNQATTAKQEQAFQPETVKKLEHVHQEAVPLPDHLNFFSTTLEDTKKSDEDSGFNRLASYFSSPPKTDNSKPFFELSQGQNHYRRNSKSDCKTEDERKQHFFELSQSQNHYMDNKTLQNMPQDKLIANLNLMKDLASYQDPDFKPEQIIRTVNYFTVEYDNENLDFSVDLNKGDVLKDDKSQELADSFIHDDKTLKTIVRKCKYCCNLNKGCVLNINKIHHEIVGKDFKVKSCMDVNKEEGKDTNSTMEKEEGSGRKHSVAVDFTNCIQEDTNEGVAMMSEVLIMI